MVATQQAVGTKRAFGYIRVSSVAQADERSASLETQAEQIERYCATRGYILERTFTDIMSGRRDDRPSYQEMLSALRGGEANTVVVMWLDRFGRKPKEILPRVWELQAQGIEIESVSEDVREELILLVRAGVAGYESRRTGERVSVNRQQRTEKGIKFGKTPYGYKGIRGEPDARGIARIERFEQDPQEVAALRMIYEMMVEEGKGYRRIADALNTAHIPSPEGKLWNANGVKEIIFNPALVRRLVEGDIVLAGKFPAIFTKAEWEALLARREANRDRFLRYGKARSSDYLLTGILRCGECGFPMGGKACGTIRSHYRYYHCLGRRESAVRCPEGKNYPVAALDKAVLDFLGQYSDENMVRAYLAASESTAVKKSAAELTTVQKRLAELDAAQDRDYDRLDRGIITEAEYQRVQERRRSEIAQLREREAILMPAVQEEQAKSAQAGKTATAIKGFFETAEAVQDVQRKKALLQSIIKSVTIFKDGRLGIEFR